MRGGLRSRVARPCRSATTPTRPRGRVLELALGVALLVLGGVVWFRPPDAPAKPDSRTKVVLARLEHLNLPAVFGAGAVLALGPKRLGLTVLVTATIAGGNIGAVYAFSLTVVVRGDRDRPRDRAGRARHRVRRPAASSGCSTSSTGSSAHKRPLTVYPVTILGVLVIVDARVRDSLT